MKQWPPKIIVCGHGGHGKDTACAMLEEISGGEWKNGGSTSQLIVETLAREMKVSYDSLYKIRHQYRELLGSMGDAMRQDDVCALIRATFKYGNIINGVRRKEEIEACIRDGLADWYIWVEDRDGKVDPTMTYDFAHLPAYERYFVRNVMGERGYMRKQLLSLCAGTLRKHRKHKARK